MKKILRLVFLFSLMAFLLIGCQEKEKVGYDEKAMEALAKQTVQDMIQGDFEHVSKNFDEQVAAQLDAKALKEAWDGVVQKIGKHVAHDSVLGEAQDANYICTVVERYEEGMLRVTVNYDPKMRISGLNLDCEALSPAPMAGADFKEQKVMMGAEKNMPLEGFLTLPNHVKTPPVVLLIQGSGQMDENETVFFNTPFKDIAHGLAQRGIATLRYDKRYFVYPKEAKALGATLTLDEEVLDDAAFAIQFLSKDSRVDNRRIYVLGHSLGGSLTPYMAATHKEVSGIISMAGTLRPLYELSYDQNKAIEKNMLATVTDEKDLETLKEKMKIVERDIQILRGDLENIPAEQMIMGASAAYQRSFKKYAGLRFIEKVQVPILVLQGEADFQVYADKDFILWKEALKNNKNVTFKLYPNLNHLMMKAQGKEDEGEYEEKGNVDLQVIEDIAQFILR